MDGNNGARSGLGARRVQLLVSLRVQCINLVQLTIDHAMLPSRPSPPLRPVVLGVR